MISPEVLRRYPFFYGFDDAQLKALAMIADERTADAQATMFEEGTPANKFYLLIEGSIDLFVKSEEAYDSSTRRDFSVGDINPGEVFGISTVLEPYIMSTTGKASQPIRYLEFNGPGLRALMQLDSKLAYQLMVQTAKAIWERLAATRVQLAAAWEQD